MDNRVHVLLTEPEYPDIVSSEGKKRLLSGVFEPIWRDLGRRPENPFGTLIKEHGVAVIKPNWVMDPGPRGSHSECLVTHSSLILQVIHWLAEAMNGHGTIVVGDAPIQGCDFERLRVANRVDEMINVARSRYPHLDILVEDWRLTVMDRSGRTRTMTGDVSRVYGRGRGEHADGQFRLVDLGKCSLLEEIADLADRFRVTCYKPSLMRQQHRRGRHRYLVTNRVFGIDLLVNLPKMKTHAKTGLTGALKNILGVNGHKEYLPHHTTGSFQQGGDCYLRSCVLKSLYERLADQFWEHHADKGTWRRASMSLLLRGVKSLADLVCRDPNIEGSWPGNDVIWRTILDLNHIVYFGENAPRHILTIVDGIVAGEGDGPLRPIPRPAGIVVVGENPAYVDAVLARIMGFQVTRVPMVYNALYHRKSRFSGPDLEEFSVFMVKDGGSVEPRNFYDLPVLRMKKPRHWKRAEAAA